MPDAQQEGEEGKALTYGTNLTTFLSIFSKFRKPAKMHHADAVYHVFDR
jgi:hypothetical protein